MTAARRGAHLEDPGTFVQQQLQVVDKAEDAARELGSQIIGSTVGHPASGHALERAPGQGQGIPTGAPKRQRRHPLGCPICQTADAVRPPRAGRETPRTGATNGSRPHELAAAAER